MAKDVHKKIEKADIEELFSRHGMSSDQDGGSREFKLFLKDERTNFMKRYESWCKKAEKIFKVSISESDKNSLDKAIKIVGMDASPESIGSLSLVALLGMIFLTAAFALVAFLVDMLSGAVPFLIMALGISAYVVYNYLRKFPYSLIEKRRIRASNEFISAVLYVVSYMRHTSNLEEAIRFAASNLEGPLANDFIKLIWDIQARKYSDIQDALNHYLEDWKEFSPEFVDSMYLVRSTLYQSDDSSRISLLNEAIERVLSGTYKRMVSYASSLRNPINTIYMMGIVLPILCMVMFPMLTSFMSGNINLSTMAIGYNLVLPAVVMLLARKVLKKRPSGFTTVDVSKHPDVPKPNHFFLGKKQVHAIIPSLVVFLVIASISIYPMLTRELKGEMAVYLSLPVIIAAGISTYVYTRMSSESAMIVLREIYEVESEFSHVVFQLGTLLMQNTPPENAFIKVASSMKGSKTSFFLEKVVNNIKRMGLSMEDSLFAEEYGAVWLFPSPIIKSTMRILIDTSKKSLKDAGVALMFVSKYLRDLNSIDEKVKESLDEVLSSMNFQVVFLTPIISGIVVGMTALITMVLQILGDRISDLSSILGTGSASGVEGAAPSLSFISGLFSMSNSTPLDAFQIMVGLYMIEIIFVIAYMLANISKPGDTYYFQDTLKRTVILPTIIYSIATAAMTLILGGLAKMVVGITGVFK